MKSYQWSILIGALLALVESIGLLEGYQSAGLMLEAPSFFFCLAGASSGNRQLRQKFQALGCDKRTAIDDTEFMKERRELQFWTIPAVAAVFTLLAVRLGWSPLIALPIPILLALALPEINRATGWNALSP